MNKFFILIVIVIIICIAFLYIEDKAFKKIFLKKRRSKDDMIEDMKKRDKFNIENWNHIKFQSISIMSKEGFKLQGYIHENTKSDKFIIIHHGYSANHYVGYQFLEPFIEENYNILLIDMRNHGESEGEFISYGYYEVYDLDRWIEYLKLSYGKKIKIGLHGQSMGAAIVLLYAGKYPEKIKFVIEDCGYKSARDVIKYQIVNINKLPFQPLYNLIRIKSKMKFKFNLDDVNPIKVIEGVNIPIMFIHGIDDKLIPYMHAVDMFNSRHYKKDRLLLVAGAQHVGACSKDRHTYCTEVKKFINSII